MKKSYRTWCVAILILIHTTVLSGCATWDITKPERIEPDLLDGTENIHPGKTDQKSVRNILGDPYISSDYWNLDIFRQTEVQHSTSFFLWLPITYVFNTIYRYTLVTYDENGIVNDIGTKLFRSAYMAAIQKDYKKLTLRVGNYKLSADSIVGEEVSLTFHPRNLDNYLRSLYPNNDCLAIVGCVFPYGAGGFRLNGPCLVNLDNSLNNIELWPNDSLLALKLSPDSHRIECSQEQMSGKRSLIFECKSSDIVYVDFKQLDFERYNFIESGISGLEFGKSEYSIEVYSEIPERFIGLHLLIWRDGNWILNPVMEKENIEFRL